jgi:hypothetical protein
MAHSSRASSSLPLQNNFLAINPEALDAATNDFS